MESHGLQRRNLQRRLRRVAVVVVRLCSLRRERRTRTVGPRLLRVAVLGVSLACGLPLLDVAIGLGPLAAAVVSARQPLRADAPGEERVVALGPRARLAVVLVQLERRRRLRVDLGRSIGHRSERSVSLN